MPSRFSPPPLKPYQPDYHPRRIPFLRRNSRWLYALAILTLYFLWQRSGVHLLPTRHPVHAPSLRYKNVDWSHYAYSQYATDSAYLCNAVMVFEALSRLGSKADRILFYPQEWDLEISSTSDRDSQLLVKARDWYGVKLIPMKIPQKNDDAWHGSFAKFFAWQQTQYERILHLDSDMTVLKQLDDLFMLPRAQIVMMRSYWELPKTKRLTSKLVLLEPSEEEFQRLSAAARPDNRPKNEFDTEILNRFYGDSAMVLSHREYGLLSSEFREDVHTNYLGSVLEKWNADRMYREASLVFFSDHPLPKPWVMWPHKLVGQIIPRCKSERGREVADCREKQIWRELYDDFRKRRKVCIISSLSKSIKLTKENRRYVPCFHHQRQSGHHQIALLLIEKTPLECNLP